MNKTEFVLEQCVAFIDTEAEDYYSSYLTAINSCNQAKAERAHARALALRLVGDMIRDKFINTEKVNGT